MPLSPTKINSIKYIETFPLSPSPEVYGLHDNADINRNIKETDNVMSVLFILNIMFIGNVL